MVMPGKEQPVHYQTVSARFEKLGRVTEIDMTKALTNAHRIYKASVVLMTRMLLAGIFRVGFKGRICPFTIFASPNNAKFNYTRQNHRNWRGNKNNKFWEFILIIWHLFFIFYSTKSGVVFNLRFFFTFTSFLVLMTNGLEFTLLLVIWLCFPLAYIIALHWTQT